MGLMYLLVMTYPARRQSCSLRAHCQRRCSRSCRSSARPLPQTQRAREGLAHHLSNCGDTLAQDFSPHFLPLLKLWSRGNLRDTRGNAGAREDCTCTSQLKLIGLTTAGVRGNGDVTPWRLVTARRQLAHGGHFESSGFATHPAPAPARGISQRRRRVFRQLPPHFSQHNTTARHHHQRPWPATPACPPHRRPRPRKQTARRSASASVANGELPHSLLLPMISH